MRYLYSFLFYLVLPLVWLRLLWRSRRLPAYRERWRERFGFYSVKFDQCLWVHAVSVGEVIAAVPLIKALQQRYATLPLVVTTMTPTGAARVQADLGDSVTHVYIPYDLPDAMARFLNTMHPVACVIMETELWPNMIAGCWQRNIPICLVNARLSAKSARGYHFAGSVVREILQRITWIAANGSADAERFVALGADKERVVVTGNIKFDIAVAQQTIADSAVLRAWLGTRRFVWIAASTHVGEEEIILAAHERLRATYPDALLILVPRHPDRFALVATLCAAKFMTMRRSQMPSCIDENAAVFLGDSMGEMLLMYGAADVAFVGGSLVPRGGHNMLEPAILGKPILTGPHVFNFAEISDLLFAATAMQLVDSVDTLAKQLVKLASDVSLGEAMSQRAVEVINANRGALARQLALIEKVMN